MLTKPMRKYVMSRDEKGCTKEHQNVYDRRIIRYAQAGLEDLKLLAENLKEEELEKIFNETHMKPFLKALLTPNGENEKRLLGLWRIILMECATDQNVSLLLGDKGRRLMMWREQAERFAWLYAATMAE